MSHLSVAPDSTAPPRRLISGSQTNGLAWVVWRELDDFLFVVSPLRAADAPPAAPIHTSPAEYSTAHKAERAAKAWCATYVPMPHRPGERGDFIQQATEVLSAEPTFDANPRLEKSGWRIDRLEKNGWRIDVTSLARGGYSATLTDPETGERAPEQPEYEDAQMAIDAAVVWACHNPTRSVREDRQTEQDMDAALAGDDMSTPFDGPGDITTALVIPPDVDAAPALAQLKAEDPEAAKVLAEAVAVRDAKLAPPAEALAPPRDEELEQLRRELALARKERDAAISGVAADFREVTAEAEELLNLAARRDQLIFELEDKKLELRSIEKKLAGKGGAVAQLVQGLARGDRSRAYQQRMPFATTPETREVVGALAEQQVAKLSPRAAAQGMTAKISVSSDAPAASLGADTWAFNGVEHTIEHQTTSNPGGACVTAWVRGHRDSTEGFGEDIGQAIEACKNMAAIVFADLAPGEVPAEGPPKPAKKSKGPKLKGHDHAAVLAAVASTSSTVEASIELGCSPFQLEKFAEKNGVTLKLPEAPPAKAGKARGRKPKGGAK